MGLEVQKSLERCKGIRLFSAADERSNHAPFVFARHFVVPHLQDPSWLETLNRVIIDHKIDYIYPAHDDVIVALAQAQERLEAPVVRSPVETCVITRSKRQTYDMFDGRLPVPLRYDDPDQVTGYPVFLKPDKGSGSQDTHIVNDRGHLDHILSQSDAGARDYLILECLTGDEYTVDCFRDRDGGLLFCEGRKRVRRRSGISMNSHRANDPAFKEYAKVITDHLDLHGAWFFQLKRDRKGIYKLLEIAPRIGGTSALHRVLGINFPLLSIYEQRRVPIEILTNDLDVEIDRALRNRYRHRMSFKAVYVDLDDTLVVHGAVNTQLIRFLYQCINRGVRIVLLTKHSGDLDATLKIHRLESIFDDVVHLNASDDKGSHIKEAGAIFIDDSFRERKAVKERLGIPVFDCSMIEMLHDDRA